MSDITIEVTTIVNEPVITIEGVNSTVEINISPPSSPTEIEVNSTIINNIIEVPQEIKIVTIEVERGVVPYALPTLSGKMKLYNLLGSNADGSVDQKTVTDNLSLKVDKVTGYSLTKNDLTDLLKTAYDNAVTWIESNKGSLLDHLSNTLNPHNVTKTQVGLSEVPNVDFTDEIAGKVDSVEDYELVSVSHLIHQSRMDIRNFNFHMDTALKNQ